jgi:HD superfamily phosphohydrolase
MYQKELLTIPEIMGLDSRRQLVRIPPEWDVPLTDRVRNLIDTAAFRRLGQITQLGLVSLVYPAALHTRFEHSLGVYRLALLAIKRLAHDRRFSEIVSPRDAELFIVAALLHDLGHWPFCHPIEDLELAEVPRHEEFVRQYLSQEPLAELLSRDWQLSADEVGQLLSGKVETTPRKLLASMLSGPVDVDKMDYLFRDSLHAGVPYGRNFDQERLLGSLCLNATGDGLAITEKGKTAAELLVFARYVMFSEVYWHHCVRAATAMFHRAFFLVYRQLELRELFRLTEREFIESLRREAAAGAAGTLLDGLFGPVRRLYKRVMQFSFFENGAIYRLLARRAYPWLVRCSEHLAELCSSAIGLPIAPHEILIDAPPLRQEVEFQVDVYLLKESRYLPLGDVSPVVRTLAEKQFDDYVKRVRIFAPQALAQKLKLLPDFQDLICKAAERTEKELSRPTSDSCGMLR